MCQTPEFLCARPLCARPFRRGLGQGDRQWTVLELRRGLRDLLGCGDEAELCDVVRLRRRLPRVCANLPYSVLVRCCLVRDKSALLP